MNQRHGQQTETGDRCLGLAWLLLTWLLLGVAPTLAQVQVRELEEGAATPQQKPVEQAPIIKAPTESETPAPLPIEVPSESDIGIRNEIEQLEQALAERKAALAQTLERQTFAETLLTRLDNEFSSLEQRLETAGLGLSDNYANLLRRRLERLEQKHLADDLEPAIKEQLEAARVEQFQLEEFGAVLDPDEPPSDVLMDRRGRLLATLRQTVGEHINALNKYFQTINTLEDRIDGYQDLVRRRLFWLPSTDPVGKETLTRLNQAVREIFSLERWKRLVKGIPESLLASFPLLLFLSLLLVAMIQARGRLKARIRDTSRYLGNVDYDRIGLTVSALGCSTLLALPGVLLLVIASLALTQGGELGRGISKGLGDAAIVLFLLGVLLQIVRPGGLAEKHFKWRPLTLEAIRRWIPRLLVVLLPVTILTPLTEPTSVAEHSASFGRLIFTLASLALALFLHKLFAAFRAGGAKRRTSKTLKFLHFLTVIVPLALAVVSMFGYHYTAVQIEVTLFISVCWLVFLTLMRYLGLRSLAVRERRLKLERLREQRAREHEYEAMMEASGSSGEGRSKTLDLPEVNLHHISEQSKSLLAIVTIALAVAGLWVLWTPVIPALGLFDEITLWSVGGGAEISTVTLADLALALLVAIGTVIAVRNLPGTLEVVLLSRMQLAPGTGYAITTVVTYLIVIFGVIYALNTLGAQWSKLQWLVAALGVGLGFGLQEIVANFVSGIILLFERPIRVGDTVTIGGITGTVSRIRIRATTLVDWDRKEQIIPNKTFVTQDLTNWTLSDSITRVIVHVGVAYGSDVDEVQAVLTRLIEANERVVDDPEPAVFCVGLEESSINFELRVFVRSMLDIMPLSHELHAAITRELKQVGIEIPFPQRDIHIRTEARGQ